jgi:hypothetical protein
MKYILVITHDGKIEPIQGFDELKKAKFQADEEVGYFNSDQNPGEVVVFELNPKGASNEVYRPELPEREDDIDEEDIE